MRKITLLKSIALSSSLLLVSIDAFAASPYFARPVSRANCLVPLPRVSPVLPVGGVVTFFESVSWNPRFWNGHDIYVNSKRIRNHLNWNGRTIYRQTLNNNTSPIGYNTWRAWAGLVPFGNHSEVNSRFVQEVQGAHYEKLLGRTKWEVGYTVATSCNLTQW